MEYLCVPDLAFIRGYSYFHQLKQLARRNEGSIIFGDGWYFTVHWYNFADCVIQYDWVCVTQKSTVDNAMVLIQCRNNLLHGFWNLLSYRRHCIWLLSCQWLTWVFYCNQRAHLVLHMLIWLSFLAMYTSYWANLGFVGKKYPKVGEDSLCRP